MVNCSVVFFSFHYGWMSFMGPHASLQGQTKDKGKVLIQLHRESKQISCSNHLHTYTRTCMSEHACPHTHWASEGLTSCPAPPSPSKPPRAGGYKSLGRMKTRTKRMVYVTHTLTHTHPHLNWLSTSALCPTIGAYAIKHTHTSLCTHGQCQKHTQHVRRTVTPRFMSLLP